MLGIIRTVHRKVQPLHSTPLLALAGTCVVQRASPRRGEGTSDSYFSNGAKRLAEHPDALGSLPVETSPDEILALSASDAVKAIHEDQPVQLVS
jgi:hypothetical protein